MFLQLSLGFYTERCDALIKAQKKTQKSLGLEMNAAVLLCLMSRPVFALTFRLSPPSRRFWTAVDGPSSNARSPAGDHPGWGVPE